jgi:hypothetical protein
VNWIEPRGIKEKTKMSVATKITYNKEKNAVELETYASEPVRLQNVRVEAKEVGRSQMIEVVDRSDTSPFAPAAPLTCAHWRRGVLACLAATASIAIPVARAQHSDPLPSWNDGPSKKAIVDFVERVATSEGPAYVAPAERIAVFDNDGTLWSEQKTKFEMRNGRPVLVRLAEVEFDDKEGKPAGIHRFIGRCPILAFGNSDGDKQMLEWTAAGTGARFMGLVHHTDAQREFAYDRKSAVGTLDAALDEAIAKGWTVVSMKDDWNTIFGK